MRYVRRNPQGIVKSSIREITTTVCDEARHTCVRPVMMPASSKNHPCRERADGRTVGRQAGAGLVGTVLYGLADGRNGRGRHEHWLFHGLPAAQRANI